MTKKSDNSRIKGLKGVAQIVAQTERNEMRYTELRGRVFWFRRRVPEPIQAGMVLNLDGIVAKVGKGFNPYIRFSLNTTDRGDARKLALKYAHLLDKAADQLKAASVALSPSAVPQHLSQLRQHTASEISLAAEAMYCALMADDDSINHAAVSAHFKRPSWKASGIPEVSFFPEIQEPHRFGQKSIDLPEVSPAGDADLIKLIAPLASWHLFQTTKCLPAEINGELLPFANAYRRFVAAMEKRNLGDIVPTPPPPQMAVGLCSWDEIFDSYFKRKGKLAQGTRDNYRLAWKSLEEDSKCFAAELTPDHVIHWIENGLGNLGETTKQTRFTWAGSIWRLGRTYGKIPRTVPNPFDDLQAGEGGGESSRKEFSLQELKAIFSVPPVQTARAVSVQAGYWIPLLGLYSGARIEELTGLEVVDIENSRSATLTMFIRPNETRPKLKNKWSKRRIPVHPKLLELGFCDYVATARKAGVQQLFPSLASSDSFGEAFVAHAKSLISVDPNNPERLLGMHCFRHCWETAKRNSPTTVDPSAAKYLAGRKHDDGSAALYGSEAGVPKLRQELKKIAYKISFLPPPSVTAAELIKQDQKRLRDKAAGQQRAKRRAEKAPSI